MREDALHREETGTAIRSKAKVESTAQVGGYPGSVHRGGIMRSANEHGDRGVWTIARRMVPGISGIEAWDAKPVDDQSGVEFDRSEAILGAVYQHHAAYPTIKPRRGMFN